MASGQGRIWHPSLMKIGKISCGVRLSVGVEDRFAEGLCSASSGCFLVCPVLQAPKPSPARCGLACAGASLVVSSQPGTDTHHRPSIFCAVCDFKSSGLGRRRNNCADAYNARLDSVTLRSLFYRHRIWRRLECGFAIGNSATAERPYSEAGGRPTSPVPASLRLLHFSNPTVLRSPDIDTYSYASTADGPGHFLSGTSLVSKRRRR